MIKARWTEEDDELLRDCIERKITAEQASKILRRTWRATSIRADRLGLSFKGRELRKTNPEELQQIREWAALRWSSGRIGRALDRTPVAVMSICGRYGITLAGSLPKDGWTAQEDERLKELRQNNLSQQAIADALGRSKFAVARKISDLGLPKVRATSDRMWDQQAADRLSDLVSDHSAAEIAAILREELDRHFTRNSVIGKASRLGLKIRPDRAQLTAANRQRKKAWRDANVAKGLTAHGKERAALGSFMSGPRRSARPKLSSVADLAWTLPNDPGIREDAPRGIKEAFLALNGHDCHWPYNDPMGDDFTFCLAPRRANAQLPYCEFHLEKSRQGSPLA